jgi:hypothetical protein
MCAVVRLRALMARQAARLVTNPPIIFLLAIAIVCLHISAKKNQKIIAVHLRQQIVHRIVWGFVWEIARVDGP